MSDQPWKYIMMRMSDGREFPVIFPSHISHKNVFMAMRRAVSQTRHDTGINFQEHCPEVEGIQSAGFIWDVQVIGLEGHSESLNVESHPYDAEHIATFAIGLGKSDRPKPPNTEKKV